MIGLVAVYYEFHNSLMFNILVWTHRNGWPQEGGKFGSTWEKEAKERPEITIAEAYIS